MRNIESHALPFLLNPRTTPPPPPPHISFIFLFFFFFIFFFFCFFKNLLRLKINILSSVYPEINFLAEPVMKINNLSRPKMPAPPPPPFRIKWSSTKIRQTQKRWLRKKVTVRRTSTGSPSGQHSTSPVCNGCGHANRGRLFLRTPGPIPFGTCIFLC